jgi:hypothetical protein
MRKGFSKWLWIVGAVPAGGIVGFFCGYYLAYAILVAQGMGNSHNDMYTVVFSGALGMLVGAVLLPIIAWAYARRRAK